MIVVITDEAEADLEHIGDYIAEHNPARALSFIRELRVKCLSLADHPYAFGLVPRYEHSNIRRRVHGRYLIFYRINDDRIEVIHILNGAMNYEPLLFPPE